MSLLYLYGRIVYNTSNVKFTTNEYPDHLLHVNDSSYVLGLYKFFPDASGYKRVDIKQQIVFVDNYSNRTVKVSGTQYNQLQHRGGSEYEDEQTDVNTRCIGASDKEDNCNNSRHTTSCCETDCFRRRFFCPPIVGPQGPPGPSGPSAENAWLITGNSNIGPNNFLGTTNNEPVVIKVDNTVAYRYIPTTDTPNIIGGSGSNTFTAGIVGATIAGGGTTADPNNVGANWATVGGGSGNTANNPFSTIGGGQNNMAAGGKVAFETIGGGFSNSASASLTTIGGGNNNNASSEWATIGGGDTNAASGLQSTIGGGTTNISSGDSSTVAGGNTNSAISDNSTVGGGNTNSATGISATIAGGQNNTTTADYAFIGGGASNKINADAAAIAGGSNNTASGASSFIGSGGNNTASGINSTVGGGVANTASGDSSTVSGGEKNIASGNLSTVMGGLGNVAPGVTTTAGGNGAIMAQDFTFGYSASSKAFNQSGLANITGPPAAVPNTSETCIILAPNGFYFYTDPGAPVVTYIAPGDSGWNVASDKNKKSNFQAVDKLELLDKLASIPIETWTYIDKETRHIGPYAQDFSAAFGYGSDDKSISTTDSDGVALGCIQGLYSLLKSTQQQLQELRELQASHQAYHQSNQVLISQLQSQIVLLSQQVATSSS